MLGMEKVIADCYGLEIKNLHPYKDSYLAVTPHGRRLLKKMPFSAGRIKFIHAAKEHLANGGFTNTDRYLRTLSGEPYFNYNDCFYTLSNFTDGRESNFENDNDVIKSAMVLAGLHYASRRYVAPGDCAVQDELGKLPGCLTKRLEDIKKTRKQAKKEKGRFDQLFLNHVEYFIDLGQNAIGELMASGYQKIVEQTRNEGLFCHHDFTHHNIIMDDEKITVTNFDYCCFELRVYDIANLIRRKMRKCDWDVSKTELIIKSYNSADTLGSDELSVMKAILLFPQKFWRVVNRYYNSRRSWSEKSFITRLQEVIDEIGPHSQFLKQYVKLFL